MTDTNANPNSNTTNLMSDIRVVSEQPSAYDCVQYTCPLMTVNGPPSHGPLGIMPKRLPKLLPLLYRPAIIGPKPSKTNANAIVILLKMIVFGFICLYLYDIDE
jgi:hypothetical protein